MSSVVIWRPEALNAKLIAAARPAAAEFVALARSRSPSQTVAASIAATGTSTNFMVGSPLPLAGWLEFGVKPHEITPRGQALKLADGSYVSGPVQHPGEKAQPFLRPLLPLWGSLYRKSAAGAFRGF